MNKHESYTIALQNDISRARETIKQREAVGLPTDSDESMLFHLEKRLMEHKANADNFQEVIQPDRITAYYQMRIADMKARIADKTAKNAPLGMLPFWLEKEERALEKHRCNIA